MPNIGHTLVILVNVYSKYSIILSTLKYKWGACFDSSGNSDLTEERATMAWTPAENTIAKILNNN